MEIKYHYNNQWNTVHKDYIDKIEEIYSNIYLWIKPELPQHIKICPYWNIDNKQYIAAMATNTGYLKLILAENIEDFPNDTR